MTLGAARRFTLCSERTRVSTMQIDDELLMRYADGELDAGERARVESAIQADPAVGRRVAAFRAQRERLSKAFAPQLEEPVPDRFRQIVAQARAASAAKVVDLGKRRGAMGLRERVRSWSWPELSAVAANLVLGVLVAHQVARNGDEALRAGPNGLVAGRALAQVLSTQLANTQPESASVRVGLTFENQRGEVCRTFTQRHGALDEFACRSGNERRVDLALSGSAHPSPTEPGSVRTAGSDLPPQLLKAVEAQIRGEPFDAAAEAEARQNAWRGR